MSNKSTPCAYAITYDGETPCHELFRHENSATLELEINRIGGTAQKMPLYANAALRWTSEKPTQLGIYLWKTKCGSPYPYVSRVYIGNDGDLSIDMKNGSWQHDMPLREVADREWYGPIPL